MAQESTHVYRPVAFKLSWFRIEVWLDVRSEFGLTLLTPLFSRVSFASRGGVICRRLANTYTCAHVGFTPTLFYIAA